jgi:argininosuccinate synthase
LRFLSPYASLVYRGFWFSPEREALQALIDETQEQVTGMARLERYEGSARVVGRTS